jgi:hypothetical protein
MIFWKRSKNQNPKKCKSESESESEFENFKQKNSKLLDDGVTRAYVSQLIVSYSKLKQDKPAHVHMNESGDMLVKDYHNYHYPCS